MKIHPVANLFPKMTVEEFVRLVEDVKKNGVREPAWTYKGFLIDGRHRWEAAKKAGVACPTQEWCGEGSLVLFVVSLNFARRHLTPSQLAAVGRDMLPLLEQEANARKKAAGALAGKVSANLRSPSPDPKTPSSGRQQYRSKASQEAAKILGVSARSIEQAKALPQAAADQVKRGEITVNRATQQYKPKPKAVVGNPIRSDFGVDRFGKRITSQAIAAMLGASADFTKLCNAVSQIKGAITKLSQTEPGTFINVQQVEADATNLHRLIRFATPYCVCVYCGGTPAGCKACHGKGVITEQTYTNAPKDLKVAA